MDHDVASRESVDAVAPAHAPAPNAAPASMVATVLQLQGQIANAAVSRMLASGRGVRRQPKATGDATAADDPKALIDKHTTLNLLDEQALAEELVHKPESVVHAVLDKLHHTDRDDVALELCKAKGDLKGFTPDMRIRCIRELVSGVVTGEEEAMIASLWRTFGPPYLGLADPGELATVAANQLDLWRKSLYESDELVAYIAPLLKDFNATSRASRCGTSSRTASSCARTRSAWASGSAVRRVRRRSSRRVSSST